MSFCQSVDEMSLVLFLFKTAEPIDDTEWGLTALNTESE